ncbi:Ribosomal-protein-S18p-alanine acetyltransferase [hydrothermal vent metagenome]|uniref:Ribosomal-protein-S18p-alanine acetyltransferase n=1 Tax=hydrothermal vent metagenome TaxID=652676 RepID=A0A3B1B8F1_9ZZZZ
MTISFAVYDGLAKGIIAEKLSKIHRLSFQGSVEQIWTPVEISSLLLNPDTRAMTIWQNAQVTGFLMWRQAREEAEILTLCILPAFRGQGMGSQILQKFYLLAAKNKIAEIFLEVRENNAAAISLYEKNAFKAVGRRKNYYSDKDALIMKYIMK